MTQNPQQTNQPMNEQTNKPANQLLIQMVHNKTKQKANK